jgi:hypothetical protein
MMRRLILPLMLIAVFAASSAHAETQRMVLVTATPGITAEDIDRDTARKLFLGRPIIWESQRITPIVNHSEDLLYQIFLQNVIHMSDSHYERYMLSSVFRLGGKRPRTVTDLDTLINVVRSRPATVTFMWESTARTTPGINVITELWKGELR